MSESSTIAMSKVTFYSLPPPLDVLPPAKPGSAIGHTARYLAEKLRRKIALEEKRKAEEGLSTLVEEAPASKKQKPTPKDLAPITEMRDEALRLWIAQMDQGTEAIYKDLYGERWEEGMEYEKEKLARGREEARRKRMALEESVKKAEEREKVSLTGSGVFLDDIDPRY